MKDLGLEIETIELTRPTVASQGDLSTNIALIAAKQAGKNLPAGRQDPRELAEQIVQGLRAQSSEPRAVEKIEVAGPGFINFFLSNTYYLQELSRMLGALHEDVRTSYSVKNVMVEFTDPNPFKEFHIGHLYSNTVGEAISRLLEAGGAEVKRANYQGDVGLHVAKAIWGMIEKLRIEHCELRALEGKSIEERAKWLGEAYALGASAYEEDGQAKQEIIAINKEVYAVVASPPVILNDSEESRDPSASPQDDKMKPQDDSVGVQGDKTELQDDEKASQHDIALLYQKGRQWSLDYFETMYARLGTKFDFYYFESKAGPIGLALVKEFLGEGVFQESEGAVVFKGEDYGLHTRVFINSLGLPTYEAKELGLAITKHEDYPFDLSISITGNEINEYFKVLLKVLSLTKPEIAEKTKHISHGMVRLPEGKMSSRTGNVLTGEWLLDEAKARLKDAYPEMDEETLEMVTVGAIKWALLRSSIGRDISFNIDESISFEGDSGPYIQYTYARTQSVLRKADDSGQITADSKDANPAPQGHFTHLESLSFETEELALLKLLVRFDEVVHDAGTNFSPNTLTTYLFDLAQAFNHFYQKQRILDPEAVILSESEGSHEKDSSIKYKHDGLRNFRLSLTEVTGNMLQSGLHLLGIKAPDSM